MRVISIKYFLILKFGHVQFNTQIQKASAPDHRSNTQGMMTNAQI